jgi:hypothetical protein
MADIDVTRREVLTQAAYMAPAIVTLPVLLSFASAGSGTPGNYGGSGTPGNYGGSGTPGNYGGSGTPGNYGGSGTPGNSGGGFGTPGNSGHERRHKRWLRSRHDD